MSHDVAGQVLGIAEALRTLRARIRTGALRDVNSFEMLVEFARCVVDFRTAAALIPIPYPLLSNVWILLHSASDERWCRFALLQKVLPLGLEVVVQRNVETRS